METLLVILAFVFVIGLCIGSFLNVVILRALSNESIVFPASKCPKCQTPLKWWHNIPVLSYVCLKGKCAFCKEPISIQYPLIELFTAVIFTLVFIKFGISVNTLFFWIVSAVMIVIAGTDIKEKVVFDIHNYILIGLGLIFSVYLLIMLMHTGASLTWINNPVTSSLLAILTGAAIMEILARSGYLIAGTRAFGEGDTFIAAGLGAIFGFHFLILILILSVVVQVILFLPLFIKGLICNKDWKTLGTFLLFVVYAGGFYALQYFNLINSQIVYLIGALILAVLGVISCIFIFKGLREKPENRTYLPFGPAMVIAGFIAMLLL